MFLEATCAPACRLAALAGSLVAPSAAWRPARTRTHAHRARTSREVRAALAVPAQRGARPARSPALKENAQAPTRGHRPLRGHGRAGLLQPHGDARSSSASSTPATPAATTAGRSARTSPGARASSPRRRRVMEAWMASPGHRRTIVNRSYREIGFGIRLGVPEGRRASARRSRRTSAPRLMRDRRCCCSPRWRCRSLLAPDAQRPPSTARRRERHRERRPARHRRRRAGRRRRARRPRGAWCGDPTHRQRHRQRGLRAERRPAQGRLRLRRRPAQPRRGLGGRAAGQRRDRQPLPRPRRAAGRRRCASTWARAAARSTRTSRSSRCPAPHAAYADDFRAVARAVQRALGDQGGPRNAVVLADALSGIGVEHGLGRDDHGRRGEQPGAANPHNRGGLTAVVFTRDGVDAARPGRARLLAGGLPARDHAHARRRAVGRAALDPARAAAGPALRPLLAGRGRHVLRRGRRRREPLRNDCAPIPGTITAATTAAATTTSAPRRRPAATSRRTGTRTTPRSWRRARSSRPRAAASELCVPAPPAPTAGPAIAGAAAAAPR